MNMVKTRSLYNIKLFFGVRNIEKYLNFMFIRTFTISFPVYSNSNCMLAISYMKYLFNF